MFMSRMEIENYASIEANSFQSAGTDYSDFVNHVGIWWECQPAVTPCEVSMLAIRWFRA